LESEWVDFRAVKSAVTMEKVLARYSVELRRVNKVYLRGKCPLPMHTSKDAMTFGVQTQKNVWACQSDSCAKARAGKRGGNVLDFVAVMESCSVRDAAARLQNWFHIVPTNGPADDNRTAKGSESVPTTETRSASVEVNRPLEFALKGVTPDHLYFGKRGITRETATAFGAGYFPGKGSMSGRIVVPIRNRKGEIIAYAGRSIDGADPKYKLPTGFRKSLELFNLHRALVTGSECVVVVEGFFDCMKVEQAGFSSVVALMGSSLSREQEDALAGSFARIALLLDGDEPGREAARTIAARLAERAFVKAISLRDGKQPDQLSSEELRAVLGRL
jgi:DNA primase